MIEQSLPIDPVGTPARAICAIRPAGLDAFLSSLSGAQAAYLREAAFKARSGQLVLLPGESGVECAVLGLGQDRSPHPFGVLAFRLPRGSWRIEPGDFDMGAATLGFCLGAYGFTRFKAPRRPPARLVVDGQRDALAQAEATWMVRDLINTPANELGRRYGAITSRVSGDTLDSAYPTVSAVGRGSDRKPVVAVLRWRGSAATEASPLVSLCGKGVCFDSGGYDLKPSGGMLRMKKDMGGAANILGLARILMEADLPIRLAVRIGCVENSVSGSAMRPLDVIRTRRGLTVEVGNTDAEGRLVLCDLLAEASDEAPALLVDAATLTGAARVAVGPDLPVLFANDEDWAADFLAAGTAVHDPLWRLPLWDGYDNWLDSPVADVNNVSSKSGAGAVVAALFMRRFIAAGTNWAHFDIYAWNDSGRPGRPEGGEATGMRAMAAAIRGRFAPG